MTSPSAASAAPERDFGPNRQRPSRIVRYGFGVAVALAVMGASFAAGAQETTTTTTTSQPPTTAASSSTTETTAATSTSSTSEGSTSSTPTTTPEDAASTTTTAANAEEKARALSNLNLAKAADVEIARQLNDINKAANVTLEKIDEAQLRIDAADQTLKRTDEELKASGQRQGSIEEDLRVKAIQGFKTGRSGEASPLLSDGDINRVLRQNGLLAQASLSTAELLEELRGLLEERRIANAEAAEAKTDAEAAEQELQAELAVLKEQQSAQLGLKAEAERRIDIWAGELTAYAKEDAAVQEVIAKNADKTPVDTAVNRPTTPSLAGFQWPVNARVTSEYGYRVHPVYRTRRLHAGMDIGAPRGTPIAAANDGVVIFAGRRGGYGSTVIVDHGGSTTTLYAHQSQINVSVGQLVKRGDIVGLVGATGTATGNHLHFEVRVDGSPTNPRSYLP